MHRAERVKADYTYNANEWLVVLEALVVTIQMLHAYNL